MFPTRSRFRAVLCFIAVATVSAVAAVQLCAQTKAPASTIQGRLLRSNGKPLAYTEVELVPITSDRIIVDHRLNATSGSSGQFSFVGVPPGKYTLSINFDDKPTELSPYDTYFYPNAGDRSAAAVFDINESTRLKGIVFRLPSPLQKMRIAGRVIWADGAPVEGAWIGFWDAEFDRSISFGMPRTDKNGNFNVIGFAGRRYAFGAIVFDREPKGPFDTPGNVIAGGESNVFVLGPDTGIITFKLVRSAESRRLLDKYVGTVVWPDYH
jgi:hypothetical protein